MRDEVPRDETNLSQFADRAMEQDKVLVSPETGKVPCSQINLGRLPGLPGTATSHCSDLVRGIRYNL